MRVYILHIFNGPRFPFSHRIQILLQPKKNRTPWKQLLLIFLPWQTWQVRYCTKATKRLTIKMSKTFSYPKIYNIQVVMLNNDSESKPTSSFHRGEGHIAREKWYRRLVLLIALFLLFTEIPIPQLLIKFWNLKSN